MTDYEHESESGMGDVACMLGWSPSDEEAGWWTRGKEQVHDSDLRPLLVEELKQLIQARDSAKVSPDELTRIAAQCAASATEYQSDVHRILRRPPPEIVAQAGHALLQLLESSRLRTRQLQRLAAYKEWHPCQDDACVICQPSRGPQTQLLSLRESTPPKKSQVTNTSEFEAAEARLRTIQESDDIHGTAYGAAWRTSPQVQEDAAVLIGYTLDRLQAERLAAEERRQPLTEAVLRSRWPVCRDDSVSLNVDAGPINLMMDRGLHARPGALANIKHGPRTFQASGGALVTVHVSTLGQVLDLVAFLESLQLPAESPHDPV